jgi:hypothetical protein
MFFQFPFSKTLINSLIIEFTNHRFERHFAQINLSHSEYFKSIHQFINFSRFKYNRVVLLQTFQHHLIFVKYLLHN